MEEAVQEFEIATFSKEQNEIINYILAIRGKRDQQVVAFAWRLKLIN